MQLFATATRTSARWKQLPAVALGILTTSAGAGAISNSSAEAKTPGKTYCFNRVCHRVKTLPETQALIGQVLTLTASHYDSCGRDRFNPCGLTSSGEKFQAHAPDNAASPIFPDGTTLLVWSAQTLEALVLRINNAGPYWGDRKLDLSRAAAHRLGVGGVSTVKVQVLRAPEPHEAVYERNRVYKPVAGPIGQFASIDQAVSGMNTAIALASSPFGSLTGGAPLQGLKLLAGGDAEGSASAAPAKVGTSADMIGAPDNAVAVPKQVAAETAQTPAKPSVEPVAARSDVASKGTDTKPVAELVTTPLAAVGPASPAPEQSAMRNISKHVAAAAKQRQESRARAAPKTAARKVQTAAVAPVRRASDRDNDPIHVGFTTYAEAHYQLKPVGKPSAKRVVETSSPGALKTAATGLSRRRVSDARPAGKASPG